jgi:hypothetical protein
MVTLAASGGGASAVGPTSGGKTYGYNNISANAGTIVANANPQRNSITFHNPGVNNIYVYQLFVQNIIGTAPASPSDVMFNPSNAAVGGTWLVGPGSTRVFTGECQKAWGAFSNTGTTNALTVSESNQ